MSSAEKCYNLVKALRENRFDAEFSNNRVFTAIFRDQWWTSHITKAALQEYIDNDFKKCKVVRAHVIDRIVTMREVLSQENLMDAQALNAFMYERNRCVIATRAENSSNQFSELLPLTRDLFPSNNIGFAYRKKIEGKALQQLAKNISKN